MSYTFAALAFSIAFKKFPDLEEQHHKHGFSELRLRSRKKTDAECTDCSYRHQEILVKRVFFHQPLSGFLERFPPGDQVWHKIYQKQLPGRKAEPLFYECSYCQKYCSQGDCNDLPPQAPFLMLLLMLMLLISVPMFTMFSIPMLLLMLLLMLMLMVMLIHVLLPVSVLMLCTVSVFFHNAHNILFSGAKLRLLIVLDIPISYPLLGKDLLFK